MESACCCLVVGENALLVLFYLVILYFLLVLWNVGQRRFTRLSTLKIICVVARCLVSRIVKKEQTKWSKKEWHSVRVPVVCACVGVSHSIYMYTVIHLSRLLYIQEMHSQFLSPAFILWQWYNTIGQGSDCLDEWYPFCNCWCTGSILLSWHKNFKLNS